MKKLDQAAFVERCKQKHGDRYQYDQTVYTTQADRVVITCAQHGNFLQVARIHMTGRGCPECAKAQRRQTILSRYGVTSFTASAEFQQKTSATLRDRYGVSNSIDIPGVREAQKITRLQRYGVEYPLQHAETRTKTSNTLNDRYGVPTPGASEVIRATIHNTNLTKYGHISPLGNVDVQRRSRQTIKERYGVDNINQLDQHTQALLNDVEWLRQMNETTSLIGISDQLRISDTTVGNYFHKHGLVPRQHQRSIGELELEQFLSDYVELDPSNKEIIAPYELDLVIPEHRLAIEFCGLYWHCEAVRPDRFYHRDKLDKCNKQGYRLLTIYEDEWANKREIIQRKLLHLIGKDTTDRVWARKCTVVSVTNEERDTFLNATHIQGTTRSTVSYGLTYQGQLVAVIALIRRSSSDWELARYSTSQNVPAGFSKLLSHFIQNHTPETIITFADLRWSEGDLYRRTNWTLDQTLSPDYYWVKQNVREHKFNFRHARISKRFNDYNPSLTEVQNCHAHGWRRLYDCGKQRYILKPKVL